MNRNTIIGIGAAIVLVVGGVVAFYLMRPEEPIVEEPIVEKPTIEEANIILDESIKKTFALTSFTTKGDVDFQVKSGEIVLVEVMMRDMQSSITDVWNFANQDSRMVVTYDVMINLAAIADLIEENMPPEELDPDMFWRVNPIAIMREMGEANIAVTMEMKSIDFDSYMRITEVTGLREVITPVAGVFAAEMVMGWIEPKMDIWFKTPADPMVKEETNIIFEKMTPFMNLFKESLPGIISVKEVLPNTKVNDIAVYNFTTDIDLNKVRDFIISLIPLIDEMTEEMMKEMMMNEMMMDEMMMDEMMEKRDATVAEIKQDIKEFWPKVVTVIEAMEINLHTYICQETRLIIKDVGTVNINLYRIITTLRPTIIEDMTPEELAEFNEAKEIIRNIDISFVITGDFIYSDHNAVPVITPPAEYQLLEELLKDIFPAPEYQFEEEMIIEFEEIEIEY